MSITVTKGRSYIKIKTEVIMPRTDQKQDTVEPEMTQTGIDEQEHYVWIVQRKKMSQTIRTLEKTLERDLKALADSRNSNLAIVGLRPGFHVMK